jgi:hypothetical protein
MIFDQWVWVMLSAATCVVDRLPAVLPVAPVFVVSVGPGSIGRDGQHGEPGERGEELVGPAVSCSSRVGAQAIRLTAIMVAVSQAALMSKDRLGKWPRPVSRPVRMRSSTRAWARWRASRKACCPAGVSVARPV